MFRKHFFDDRIRKYSIMSFWLFMFIQLIALISPLFMKRIIDSYIPTKDLRLIVLATALMVFMPLIVVLSNTLYNYLSIKFARNRGNEIAIELLENVVFQEIEYFKKQNSMELVSYLSKEAVTYVSFYIRELPKYMGYIIVSTIILALMVYYNPVIGLAQLLYIPIAIIPIRIATKQIDKQVKFIVEKNASLMQKRSDLIKGIEYIKGNNLEKIMISNIKEENNSIVSTWGKVAALDSLTGFWSVGFVTALFSGLTFGISAILFISNSVFAVESLGMLILLYSYAILYYNNINNGIRTQVDRKKQEAEFAKMLQFFELVGEREKNKEKQEVNKFLSLEFSSVYFSYDRDYSLENVSFRAEKGQWIGVQGDSGVGKTTLLNLLIKIYETESGKYFINDIDSIKFNTFSIRNLMTKISQDIFLFPGTIYSNFKLVNGELTEKEIFDYLCVAELNKFVESLPKGLNTEIGEMGKLISGGEKQRLSLAIGLARGTAIVLLDEVTANLDTNVERKIMNNLFRLKENKELTIISVSHRKNFHSRCDFIVELSI